MCGIENSEELVGGKGLEGNDAKTDSVSGSVNEHECSAAKSAARPLETADFDAALQVVLDRLPAEAGERVLAIVREVRGG
jgi:hypothetical protein